MLPPTATTPKHHLHVPRPPPPTALLIPLHLLPQACLSHRQPSPYDLMSSFCSSWRSPSRILPPLTPVTQRLHRRRFINCGVPLPTAPTRAPMIEIMATLLLVPLIFWFRFGGDKKIFGMSNTAVGKAAIRLASTAAPAIQTTLVSVSSVLFGCFYANN
jgi:hypothetical protein